MFTSGFVVRQETIVLTRNNCFEMLTIELDMLVLANLDAHCHKNVHTSKSDNAVKRTPVDDYFGGNQVCKDMFLFLHGIGPQQCNNLVAHFDKNGLISRVHGNAKPLSANTISLEWTRSLYNFATTHALTLSGYLPHQFSDEKTFLLSTHIPKKDLFIATIAWFVPRIEKIQ